MAGKIKRYRLDISHNITPTGRKGKILTEPTLEPALATDT